MSSTQSQIQTNQEDNLFVNFTDPKFSLIAKALSSKTRRAIILLINKEPLDVSRISQNLGQTEANISAQIKILDKAGLVTCSYSPGSHGVRKICSPVYKKIEIELI